MTTTVSAGLPDLFRFENGRAVRTRRDWFRRREEMAKAIVGIEYGGMPPVPRFTTAEHLHTTNVRPLKDARYVSYRVVTGPKPAFSFLMTLLVPAGKGPFPVVLNGDACWRYVTDAVAAEVVGRGNILAQFNRVEIVPDVYSMDRTTGLYRACPKGTYGALSAWAWGYHRCVDALREMECVDPDRIAIVGHSRGGKTTLLAGATDPRIALTGSNNSGSGGAGCYRRQGPKSETLADTIRIIRYWFGPRLPAYVGREAQLPFDQHFLKALVAPRPLLTTEALGDLWANPTGTWLTHEAAREAYRFLGVPDRIGIWFRRGGHAHGLQDWRTFLDFMDWHFRGRRPKTRFDIHPFGDLPPARSWSTPRGSKRRSS